jgi:hypothetical protein
MADQCRKDGIRCAFWSDGQAPPYDAQIVFKIAEAAVSQSFADFVNTYAQRYNVTVSNTVHEKRLYMRDSRYEFLIETL